MKSCSICKADIENENPSVLTMGGYGNPRYVCEDNAVIDTMQEMMRRAGERAAAIEKGTYDFSEDASEDEEEMIEIPEELRETEEDRALDEKDAEAEKKFDKIMNWAWAGILAAFVIYFAYIIIRRYL